MKTYPIKTVGPWEIMRFRAEADSSDPRPVWATPFNGGNFIDIFRLGWIEGEKSRALTMTIFSFQIAVYKKNPTPQHGDEE